MRVLCGEWVGGGPEGEVGAEGAGEVAVLVEIEGGLQLLRFAQARLAINLAVRQTVGVVAHMLCAPVVSRGRG